VGERLLRYALRQGYRRGLRGGSRVWLAAGGAAVAVRAVRWVIRPGRDVVVHEILAPGQTLVITHLDEPS
jgi:hypothetical protein